MFHVHSAGNFHFYVFLQVFELLCEMTSRTLRLCGKIIIFELRYKNTFCAVKHGKFTEVFCLVEKRQKR